MKVTDEMVEAALKAHYSAWGTAKKSQDMYRDAMRAALEAVIPLSDPAAWQWLDTANFRKAIPESSNPSEWNPLYRHPTLSHAAGQEAVDTGNLISDPLYLALDALYSRGWTDRGRHDHDPRGTNEWQAVLDIYRANAAPAQAPINPAEIDRKLVGGEAVAWRTIKPCGLRRYMTQAQYDANPSVQKWYEPFKCADCRAPAHPPASADVGLDAAGQWELVPSGFLIDGPNGTAMVLDRAFIEPKIAALCENNGDDPEDYTATELYMKAWRGRAVDMPTMAASSGRKGDAT